MVVKFTDFWYCKKELKNKKFNTNEAYKNFNEFCNIDFQIIIYKKHGVKQDNTRHKIYKRKF